MAPGQITQEVYARGLPEGVKLLITDVSFKVPSGEWWPTFGTMNHTFTKNDTDEVKRQYLPVEVTKHSRDGWLGTSRLSSLSVSDTGAGPEIYLRFQLQGSTSVGGQPVDLSSTRGFITVSSTEWGWLARPDYCNVTYQVQDAQPRNQPVEVPVGQSPKDVSLVMAASPSEGKVGINASVDPDAVKDMIGYALQGIFKAHEKAAGWVIGAL